MKSNEDWMDKDSPLPCPFCGAEGKSIWIEFAVDETCSYIYCKFCGARGPESDEMEKTCMKWNRRIK